MIKSIFLYHIHTPLQIVNNTATSFGDHFFHVLDLGVTLLNKTSLLNSKRLSIKQILFNWVFGPLTILCQALGVIEAIYFRSLWFI